MKEFPGRQFSVLVVDDNISNIQVVGNVLKENGYAVGFATSGEQAVELIRKTEEYDLILLDVDMPYMNGFETCRTLRKDKSMTEIPIIFLTAFADEDKIVEGFNAGGQDYITKPFNARELLARVNTHLQLKYKSDQLSLTNISLEQSNRNITDSITYASRIQHALLPSQDILRDQFTDFFILYKAKNIVSGDFYWLRKCENLIYIACADCTGHGIPGAFMSILGLSALNEIVTSICSKEPASILSDLRARIINDLSQQPDKPVMHDGMDIALCSIDLNEHILKYAGAFRPLLLMRENELNANSEIIEIKADQIPVGNYPFEESEFTNHTINIQQGDRLYLSSDGYASQFEGNKPKKFSTRRLRELLYHIHRNPMENQKKKLESAFNEWKAEATQTDDILIMGVKLNW